MRKKGVRAHNSEGDFKMRKQLFQEEEAKLREQGRLKVIRGQDLLSYLSKNNYRVPKGYMLKLDWGRMTPEQIAHALPPIDFKELTGKFDLSNIDFGGASLRLYNIQKDDKVKITHSFGIGNLTFDACNIKHPKNLCMSELDIEGNLKFSGGNYENLHLGSRFNIKGGSSIACGGLVINGASISLNQIENLIVKGKTFIMKGSNITDNKFINSALGELDGDKANCIDFVCRCGNNWKNCLIRNIDTFFKGSKGIDTKKVQDMITNQKIQTGNQMYLHSSLGTKLIDELSDKHQKIMDGKDGLFVEPKEQDNAEEMVLNQEEINEKDEQEQVKEGYHKVKGKAPIEDNSQFKQVKGNLSIEGIISAVNSLINNGMVGGAKITIALVNGSNKDRIEKDKTEVKLEFSKEKDIEKEYQDEKNKENERKHEDSATNDKSARENSKDLGDTR